MRMCPTFEFLLGMGREAIGDRPNNGPPLATVELGMPPSSGTAVAGH